MGSNHEKPGKCATTTAKAARALAYWIEFSIRTTRPDQQIQALQQHPILVDQAPEVTINARGPCALTLSRAKKTAVLLVAPVSYVGRRRQKNDLTVELREWQRQQLRDHRPCPLCIFRVIDDPSGHHISPHKWHIVPKAQAIGPVVEITCHARSHPVDRPRIDGDVWPIEQGNICCLLGGHYDPLRVHATAPVACR